jgi:hypothetical protein
VAVSVALAKGVVRTVGIALGIVGCPFKLLEAGVLGLPLHAVSISPNRISQ